MCGLDAPLRIFLIVGQMNHDFEAGIVKHFGDRSGRDIILFPPGSVGIIGGGKGEVPSRLQHSRYFFDRYRGVHRV